MKFNSYYIPGKKPLTNEVILSTYGLSRLGMLPIKELAQVVRTLKDAGHRVVLEWDILMTGDDFDRTLKHLEKIDLDSFDAIRVQDPGAIEYLLEQTNANLQVILETGNHNLTGLKTWEAYLGNRCERFILSIEINKEKLSEYKQALSTELEILGLGPLLIFYTPRKLLSAHEELKEQMDKQAADFIEVLGKSEESPHRGFKIQEHIHGTFMYYPKDFCLLDVVDQVEEIEIDFLRIDLRKVADTDKVYDFLARAESIDNEAGKIIKELYPKDLIRGFFNKNKSNVLFPKLKNSRISRKDDKYVGVVMEVEKKKYLAVRLKSNQKALKIGASLQLITPEGKTYETEIKKLENTLGESWNGETLAVINYFGSAIPKSQIYLG